MDFFTSESFLQFRVLSFSYIWKRPFLLVEMYKTSMKLVNGVVRMTVNKGAYTVHYIYTLHVFSLKARAFSDIGA